MHLFNENSKFLSKASEITEKLVLKWGKKLKRVANENLTFKKNYAINLFQHKNENKF